jgi:hypothetical protein
MASGGDDKKGAPWTLRDGGRKKKKSRGEKGERYRSRQV